MLLSSSILLITCTLVFSKLHESLDHNFTVWKYPEIFSLGGSWTAVNSNGSLSVESKVPGSIYTDLIRQKIIGDPYFRQNDIAYRWIPYENWTFQKSFVDECNLLQKKRILLVAHGLDSISSINVNGKTVGYSDNMFIRYMFDVKPFLEAKNVISVSFQSPVEYARKKHEIQLMNYVIPPTCPPPVQHGECHVNYIRKAQSSFSWDWGPSFPTQGIWKPIELIGFDSILITDVTVFTNLSKSQRSLKTAVYMQTASEQRIDGIFEIYINDIKLFQRNATIKPNQNLSAKSIINIQLPSSFAVKLWWPNGLGDQPIYRLTVVFSNSLEKVHKSVNFGFRTIELIQEPVANSSGLSFYFRVNGVPFFAKGSNWIPADSFLERVTQNYTLQLLLSAKDAHMNMLRVWGGGVYETNEFYDLADRLGILIWQDLMFACALYPTNDEFLDSVKVEVTQQVRRLQHHPSLLLWAGNNENEQSISGYWWPAVKEHLEQYKKDYVKLYISTIAPIVQQEDPSRPFLPSSPSNGPKTAKEGWISGNPQDNHYGDVHFYTYSGDEWNPETYPRARFVSEYGFQSYPSFESLSSVSLPEDWTYPLSPFMEHRQHHMFGGLEIGRMVSEHFTLPSNTCGTHAFKDILYLSQIVQAVAIKTETEKYRRSSNEIVSGEGKTMGALYWQLNDIWPAPSWSSIEYGGKWKMLHYFAKKFFSPVLLSSYEKDGVAYAYVISELATPLEELALTVRVFSWSSLTPLHSETIVIAQVGKSSNVYEKRISDVLKESGCSNEKSCFLYFALNSSLSEENISTNYILLSELKSAIGLKVPNISISVSDNYISTQSNVTFKITLQTDAIAPFVWLEASSIPGTFSDNGFLMVSQNLDILFYSQEAISKSDFVKKLFVRSLQDTCIK